MIRMFGLKFLRDGCRFGKSESQTGLEVDDRLATDVHSEDRTDSEDRGTR